MKMLLIKWGSIPLVLIFLYSCSGGGFPYGEYVETKCGEHPYLWALMDKKAGGEYQYYFGDKHQEYKSKINDLVERYLETGKEAPRSVVIALSKEYAPEYMKSCVSYYGEFLLECEKFGASSDKFSTCEEKFDYAYKELIASYMEKEYDERGRVDFSKISLRKLRTTYRTKVFRNIASER